VAYSPGQVVYLRESYNTIQTILSPYYVVEIMRNIPLLVFVNFVDDSKKEKHIHWLSSRSKRDKV